MKARDIVGRRIVAIGQEQFKRRECQSDRETSFNWIKLDNETVISFCAHESDGGPYVAATVNKPKRGNT